MRIDLTNSIARQLAAETTAKKSGKPEQSPLAPEDKANFSHATPSVNLLVEGALTLSAARQERVSALRDAVSAGKYSVDAETVADAMIKESGN